MVKCKKCGKDENPEMIFECVDCGNKYCEKCATDCKMICPTCFNEIRRI